MNNWDVVFLDTICPKYFDSTIFKKTGLGGTESAIVRVAEGLAMRGLRVAIILGGCDPFKKRIVNKCVYMHVSSVRADMTCSNYVELRHLNNPNIFPEAKKFLWIHNPGLAYRPKYRKNWPPLIEKYKTTVIGVSQWHIRNLKLYFPTVTRMKFISNAVPDEVFVKAKPRVKFDPNLLIWAASPHKGLDKAIELLGFIRRRRPSIKMIAFDPGYDRSSGKVLAKVDGLEYIGAVSCLKLWEMMKRSLCVFYPANQNESFGCIASEANAVGTPILTYNRGAIAKVVSTREQLVDMGDDFMFVEKTIRWHDGARPLVFGRPEFRLSEVLDQWLKLFNF